MCRYILGSVQTKSWSPIYRAGSATLVNDLHGSPALLVDKAGYVHVFWGRHASALMHARTTRPGDISAWTQMPNMATKFTYPQPLLMDDGSIEIYYRGDGYDWVYRRSTDNGKTWAAPVRILDAVTPYGWYANFQHGGGNEVLAAYTSVDWDAYFTGTQWARHNVYFMHRDAAGVWRNAQGSALVPPLTRPQADLSTRIFSSGVANCNEVTVKQARDGDHLVMFATGSGHGPGSYAFKMMRFDSGVWSTSEIGRTDHFFDCCSLSVEENGTLRAYTTEGGTSGTGSGDRDYTDIGGLIVERTSDDGGTSWSAPTTISPQVPGTLYNDPMVVQDATATARVLFNEWRKGSSLFNLRVYLAGSGGCLGRPLEPQVLRVAGKDRIDVAVRTSATAFPTGSTGAVITNSTAYADAAVAAPLAYTVDGPVLLTGRLALDSRALAELKRLRPGRVVLVGGTGSLSYGVLKAVKTALPSAIVERVGGSDRYAVAGGVAARMATLSRRRPDAAFVVRGLAFADAISVSSWAAYSGRPILLAEGAWLPDSTAAALMSLGVTRTIVVGDATAIAPVVFDALPSATRIAGSSRYDTSSRVAAASLGDNLRADRVVVAGGRDFADGLAGSVLAARLRAPLVLTASTGLDPGARSLLASGAGTTFRTYVLGGTATVPDPVLAEVRALIMGATP